MIFFKTITTDNGSEFADLSQPRKSIQYTEFTMPILTLLGDQGTVERPTMVPIRRFIPKEKQ